MLERTSSGPAIAAVDARWILELEQRSIRIPSSTFEEGEIADLYANVMSDMGLEVEMMEVLHPHDPAKKSRQPIGRLRGTGGGPTLMLNGHMDPGAEMSGWTVDPLGAHFEDGWIWGMGAHDDKGGCVAAISAVDAIIRSRTRRRPCHARHRAQARGRRHPGVARPRSDSRFVHKHGTLKQYDRKRVRRCCDGAPRVFGPGAVLPL
jgi:Peptidase family M20/M25/M40